MKNFKKKGNDLFATGVDNVRDYKRYGHVGNILRNFKCKLSNILVLIMLMFGD